MWFSSVVNYGVFLFLRGEFYEVVVCILFSEFSIGFDIVNV